MTQDTATSQRISAPRPGSKRNIRSVILTARNQIAFCQKHNLPVGEERARRLIERMEAKLASPNEETSP
jgi:hypothetical protein